MKTRFQSREEMQNARINCLDISARASMALKRIGIESLHQIQNTTDLHRLLWPLTSQQLHELRAALATWTQRARWERDLRWVST